MTRLLRAAIVGAATLKGRELKEVLEDRRFPAHDVRLLDDDQALGQLEPVGDEMSFVQPVARDNFEGVDVAFFTSDAAFTRRYFKLALDSGCSVVDLSYALAQEPGFSIKAPLLDQELGQSTKFMLDDKGVVPAHPAAVALGLILLRLRKAGEVRACAVTMFEPASEQGQRGLDELHEQTVKLLSIQKVPQAVFDTQVAFNMVSQYGAESKASLARTQELVLNHLRMLTGGWLPLPSLIVLQAPVFHAHTFSIYLEFSAEAEAQRLADALAGEYLRVVEVAEELPSNVAAAGQEDVLVSVRKDSSNPRAAWLWAAADNLKLAAIVAVECGRALGATRSSGTLQ